MEVYHLDKLSDIDPLTDRRDCGVSILIGLLQHSDFLFFYF